MFMSYVYEPGYRCAPFRVGTACPPYGRRRAHSIIRLIIPASGASTASSCQ